ncbi:hypothetical protein [Paramagnetospirillum magneticum]|nr:hypothetical protein [Paramagnetospirillum magneticum]
MVLVVSAPALAGEDVAAQDLPPADPPGTWWRITQDADSTDSKCIGQLTSPLCAVESWLACYTRSDKSLCALAELDYVDRQNSFKSALYKITRYHVVASWVLGENDIPRWYRHACTMAWRPGDVVIDTDELECWRDQHRRERCPTGAAAPSDRFRHVVRRGDDGLWRFVGREGPSGWHWLYNGTCYE